MSIRSLLRLDRSRKVLRDKAKTVVNIRPFSIRQTVMLSAVFGPVAGDFLERGFNGLASLQVQADNADALIQVIAIAIDKSFEFAEGIDKRDWDEIWAYLFESQRDFFHGLVRRAETEMTTRLLTEMTDSAPTSNS